MNKQIIEVGEKIIQQVGLEKDLNTPDHSIGYFEGSIQDQSTKKWILRKPKARTSRDVKDFHGNVVGAQEVTKDTIYTPSNTIYRDSLIGGQILKGTGTSEYQGPRGDEYQLVTEVLSTYLSVPTGAVVNGKISLLEGSQEFSFENLENDLHDLKKLEAANKEEKSKLEALRAESDAAKALRDSIDTRQKEINDLKAKVARHIAQEVALRDQPILDKFQDAVRRSKIFDGPLVINGGPGTGKTTALIQRITFLTSSTVEESISISEEVKEVINFDNPSWVFYSPSDLLKHYLSAAMTAEGLIVTDKGVRTWENHRRVLMRESGFINPETKKPFVYKGGDSFFVNTSSTYLAIKTQFESYLIKKQLQRINNIHDERLLKILQAGTDKTLVSALVKNVLRLRDETKRALSFEHLESWVGIYIQLQKSFRELFAELDKEATNLLKSLSSQVHVRIKKDPELLTAINKLISHGEVDEIEDEEDNDDVGNDDLELTLDRSLQAYLRNSILNNTYPSDNKLTKKNGEIDFLVKNIISDIEDEKLGILLFFRKYYQRPTQGLESNLLSDLFRFYKTFRKTQLDPTFLTEIGRINLEKSVKNGNKGIYNDEVDFLLTWIFELAKQVFRTNQGYYKSSNHPFITCFDQNQRAVVAIDEATDFSVFELSAMTNLSHPLVNSVTLSGDLMQRLTSKGIHDWKEFSSLFPDTEIKDLKIAYRQTARLLEVATTIYQNSVNQNAEYISYFSGDSKDPAPLKCISDDDDEKIEWIADRIVEIHALYGTAFPSVAIFVEDDSACLRVANQLKAQEKLEESGLTVTPCVNGQILGDKQSIRVYSIEYIKGLEFGAVFFHNLDSLRLEDTDLMTKYMYVGLSRANLFLGITLNSELQNDYEYLNPLFESSTWKTL